MSRTFLIATSAAAVLCAAGASSAATNRFQTATAKEAVTGILDPGSVTCIGGEPASLFCTPGTQQTHVRGRVSSAIYLDIAGEAAALIDGTNTIVGNSNLDENLQGHFWGTFHWQIPAQGGQWEGTWSGQFDLANFSGAYTAVGHGSGGTLEGLQIKVDGVYPGGSPFADLVVRIQAPGDN